MTGDRVVALTFDDGPDPRWTPQILAVLTRYGVRATFFDVGRQAVKYPELVRAEAAAGNGVANHTWDHVDLPSSTDYAHQVDDTSRLLAGLARQRVSCARPPNGAVNPSVVAQLGSRGLSTVLWDIDPSDYRRPGPDVIASRVLSASHPGAVVILHDGGGDRSQTVAALPFIIEGLQARGLRPVSLCGSPPAAAIATPSSAGEGYWVVDSTGRVGGYGAAGVAASTSGQSFHAPIVGMASSPDGQGYWLAASDGRILSSGDAGFFGSAGGQVVKAPIVGIAATPDGLGYCLAGSDGGIFAFGDAGYFGSMGGLPINSPIVSMAATSDGRGYWLAGADGGIFAFGNAGYFGSMGDRSLNSVVVAMASTPDGHGYWLVGSDGGIFAFGDAGYFGSMGGRPTNSPIVSMAATPDGRGYWLVGADGGIFAFGNAVYLGSGN